MSANFTLSAMGQARWAPSGEGERDIGGIFLSAHDLGGRASLVALVSGVGVLHDAASELLKRAIEARAGELTERQEQQFVEHVLRDVSGEMEDCPPTVLAVVAGTHVFLGSVQGGIAYLCHPRELDTNRVLSTSGAGLDPHVSRFDLEPGDRLVLGSGSFSPAISDSLLWKWVGQYRDAQKAASWVAMAAAVRVRQHVSVMVARVDEPVRPHLGARGKKVVAAGGALLLAVAGLAVLGPLKSSHVTSADTHRPAATHTAAILPAVQAPHGHTATHWQFRAIGTNPDRTSLALVNPGPATVTVWLHLVGKNQATTQRIKVGPATTARFPLSDATRRDSIDLVATAPITVQRVTTVHGVKHSESGRSSR